jgi:chemotaxis signal transduction protein
MTESIALSLQERLDAVRIAIARDARRSPDAARGLLESRARRLARPVEDTTRTEADALDLLVCEVGDERLAVPLASIVAVARPGNIARLPRAVAPVFGVTAWRGRPLTVLSVAAVQAPTGDQTRLVVLGAGARAALALVVDAVDDVLRVQHGDLAPPGPGPRHRYALGITADGLLVLSGDALLTPESLSP